jgi:gamma-glutamyl:cysteine ligase YbdK (ATP-grasp superfamily)
MIGVAKPHPDLARSGDLYRREQAMTKKKTPATNSGPGLGLEYLVVDANSLSPMGATTFSGRTDDVTWTSKDGTCISFNTTSSGHGFNGLAGMLAKGVSSAWKSVRDAGNGVLLPCSMHPLMELRAPVGGGEQDPQPPGSTILRMEIPFADEQEFGRLHTAIRMVLPLIPAISSSSPFINGKWAVAQSARLLSILEGEQVLPELTGAYIPEVALDQADYFRIVLEPIARGLAERGMGQSVDYQQANRRAAIPSFEHNVITITVADTQESVGAAVAVAEMIAAVVQAMKEGRWVSNYLQRAWHEADLRAILLDVVKNGADAVLANRDYLLMFGKLRESATAGELWRHIYQHLRGELSETTRIHIAHILDHGNLAQRILRRTGHRPTREDIVRTCLELCACLQEDRQFV